MASIPREIIQKHNILLAELADHMPVNDLSYANFIAILRNADLPPGRLRQVEKDPAKLFELMEQRGKLKVGDYTFLEEALKGSSNLSALDLVRKLGSDIRKDLDPKTSAKEETAPEVDRSPNKRIKSAKEETSPELDRSPNKRIKSGTEVTTFKLEASPNIKLENEVQDDGNRSKNVYEKGNRKGLLLILNFTEERTGTHFDVSALKKFFEDTLNFDVEDPREDQEHDLTLSELDQELDRIKTLLTLQAKKYYCFFCAVLSHGNENGIRCGDGQYKSVDDMMKTFTNDKISKFGGRPRVFLIQACRGDDIQKDYPIADDWPAAISDVAGKTTVPSEADVLIAYATTPGNIAWRYENIGSWFIHVTISVFKSYHKYEHVEEMLIRVKEEIAIDKKWKPKTGERMMPCTWSTLTKKLMI